MLTTMKTPNRWLGFLSLAVVMTAAGVVAYSSDSEGCYYDYLADGDCDDQNNNAECGFDSGDCCACTCVSTDSYTCGENGYACVDPDASCVDDDDITIDVAENCDDPSRFGDGYCDIGNNKEVCGYDGGDCCECTCSFTGEDDEYDYHCRDFACVDPSAPCVDEDEITIEMMGVCRIYGLGDGYCDTANNNEICGYDLGDCCECTCQPQQYSDDYTSYSTYSYSSCANNFACIDPNAPCVDDDDITADISDVCDPVTMANAYCDENNNRPECAYDGGDCCECTCEDRPPNTMCGQWGSFACIDPEAACVNDDDVTVDQIDICDTTAMGNGWCDDSNNNAECNYDGGDCCECTCDAGDLAGSGLGSNDYRCGPYSGFACIDPAAPCVDDDSVTVDMIDNCYAAGIGNGYCDDYNNNADCAYDGGDCCECTCDGSNAYDDSYACSYGFACIDPDAPCVDDDSVTVDMYENCGYVQSIGNSYCDDDNNKPECGYDGGDCCECTCVPDTASTSDTRWQGCKEFACIDPDATCVNDDDITEGMFDKCGYVSGIGNGYCDPDNNNADCNFDGGDCCSCTCEPRGVWDDDYACSTSAGFDCKDTSAPCYGEESTLHSYDDDDDYEEPMSYEFVPWEQDGDLPTVEGAVEVGEKTEVGVTATAYDTRPGASSGQVGCGEEGGNGCEASNTRDGISSEIESRWSCATKLVPNDGPCQIEYTFAAAQDIVDIQVAFWKGNERIRTLEVYFDGLLHHTHESYMGSTFNTLGVSGTSVTTVMLQSIDLMADEWISLIEVLIFVTP